MVGFQTKQVTDKIVGLRPPYSDWLRNKKEWIGKYWLPQIALGVRQHECLGSHIPRPFNRIPAVQFCSRLSSDELLSISLVEAAREMLSVQKLPFVTVLPNIFLTSTVRHPPWFLFGRRVQRRPKRGQQDSSSVKDEPMTSWSVQTLPKNGVEWSTLHVKGSGLI